MSTRFIGLTCLVAGLVAGCAEYFFDDHWLYVNGDTKYLYPPVEFNIAVSTIAGLIVSAAAWGVLETVDWMRRRRRQRR